MDLKGSVALVTGGLSGLGRAVAECLREAGASVVIVDLPNEEGDQLAAEVGASFVPADVTDAGQVEAAVARAEAMGSLRAVVHCAARGGPMRVLDREGRPGSLDHFAAIVNVNLVGSFNILRLASASMARNELVDGERGVIVLTASIAAFEGQVGQVSYASSKAGVAGMTIAAARDLASHAIRVCTIAPGTFDTPMLARLPADVKQSLGAAVPHPARLGAPQEFALLAQHIVANPFLNGETIRLDGALRMAPR